MKILQAPLIVCYGGITSIPLCDQPCCTWYQICFPGTIEFYYATKGWTCEIYETNSAISKPRQSTSIMMRGSAILDNVLHRMYTCKIAWPISSWNEIRESLLELKRDRRQSQSVIQFILSLFRVGPFSHMQGSCSHLVCQPFGLWPCFIITTSTRIHTP
jgi:hypothetical protein